MKRKSFRYRCSFVVCRLLHRALPGRANALCNRECSVIAVFFLWVIQTWAAVFFCATSRLRELTLSWFFFLKGKSLLPSIKSNDTDSFYFITDSISHQPKFNFMGTMDIGYLSWKSHAAVHCVQGMLLEGNLYVWEVQAMWRQAYFHIHQVWICSQNNMVLKNGSK